MSGLLRFDDPADWRLRAALVVGMAIGPLVYLLATGQMPAIDLPISNSAVVIGGLIVGVGVSYGGGCTSGHGVCGNARFSRRSMVATLMLHGHGLRHRLRPPPCDGDLTCAF